MPSKHRLPVAQPHGKLVPRTALTSGPAALLSELGLAGAGEAAAAANQTDADELLQVGELAKAVGKTVRAIHLYEDMGLLHASERSEKGRYRLFAPDTLQRVRWIAKLQSLGLSLAQIQELVREHEDADSARLSASKLREVYLDKLTETRSKLRELKALEAELQASLVYLSTCDSACEPALPVNSCTDCGRHPETPAPPELVAGLHLS